MEELEKKVQELENQIKERETSRFRATTTLIEDVIKSVNGDKKIPISSIKGFIFSLLFPRSIIVIGSIIGTLLLGIQTYVLISQNKIVERQNQLISFEQTSNFRELLFQPPFDSLGNTLNIFEGRPGLIKNWPQPNSSNVYQLSQFGKIEPETVLPALRTLLGDRHTSISSSALLSLYELAIQYDLGGLDFRGTNLHKSTLNNAVLQGANLSYASISGSNLTSTFLNFVIFDYADLSLSNLSNSEIAKSSFEFTDLSYANLNSVTVFNDIKTMAGANIIYG